MSEKPIPERWRNRYAPGFCFPADNMCADQMNLQLATCIEELGAAEACLLQAQNAAIDLAQKNRLLIETLALLFELNFGLG